MEKMVSLSDGEFNVMEHIWDSTDFPTQTQVLRMINRDTERKLNVSTVATYLRRIICKGYLEKVDTGNGHPTYHPLISKDEYFARNAAEFVERWGVGSYLKMAAECLSRQTKEEKKKFLSFLKKKFK